MQPAAFPLTLQPAFPTNGGMSDPKKLLAGHPVGSVLSPEELDAVAAKLEVITFADGDAVPVGGDGKHSILFVVEGAIELIAPINDSVERIIETARAGAAVGQVSFFDQKPNLGRGRAIEDTTGLLLTRAAYDALSADRPETALLIQSHLVRELCSRVRILGAQYVHSVEWGLQISGAIHLNLERFITEQTVLTLDLTSGKSLSGTLLRIDQTDFGPEIFLRAADGDLLVVPWKSVTTARIPGELVDRVAEQTTQEG